jgi:hypothetical protein
MDGETGSGSGDAAGGGVGVETAGVDNHTALDINFIVYTINYGNHI